MSSSVRGIEVGPVTAWLDANVEGLHGPYQFDQIAGGRSNLTFRVTDAAGTVVVLRRPPLGHVLATAHDMSREHRVISAVGCTPVPLPATLGLCLDESVNGAPFYVMSYVEGVVLHSPAAGLEYPETLRRPVSEHFVDVLVDLHDVDVEAVGLSDLARHHGYVERQLTRWAKQWANSKTREIPAVDEVERRLRAQMPEQQGVSIVHGDYRFGNVLCGPTGRIMGVLDWELCTLGDPLADVGWILAYWVDPGEPSRSIQDPTGPPGFITRAEVVERYAKGSGRDLSRIGFYEALAQWRLTVISQGIYVRYANGAMGDDQIDLDDLDGQIEAMAERALAAIS